MPDSPSASAASRRPLKVRSWIAAGASAAGLTALATAGLAGTAGTAAAGPDGHAIVLEDTSGTRSIVLDGPGGLLPTASPSPAAAAPGKAPQMRLQLAYKRTGPQLALTISLAGFVYEPLDASNRPMSFPTPATAAIGLGHILAWGDGQGSEDKAEGAHCGTPQNLHEVKDSFTLDHTYAGPGEYTVTYTYMACGLTDNKITATLPITVV